MSANNTARIGKEQIETNAALRDLRDPVGIGACLAHLMLALGPIPVEPEQEEKTV